MKTLLLKHLLATVCAFLFAASDVHAFYMAEAGRWINRDPIAETGGMNLYSFVVNQPMRFMDRWGLAPGGGGWGGELYGPGKGTKSKGNCWRYACGDPAKPGDPLDPDSRDEPHSPNPPGWTKAKQPSCKDPCKELMDGINGAGGKSPDTSGKCPPGMHKITVQYSPDANHGNPDFHFSREDSDGTWSEKSGYMEPHTVEGPNKTKDGYTKCGETCVSDNWDTDSLISQ
jgi:hypothetical protein